jgi:hypothetical protein
MKEILLQVGELQIRGFYSLSAWTLWDPYRRIGTVGYTPSDASPHPDMYGCWPRNDGYQECGVPIWGY